MGLKASETINDLKFPFTQSPNFGGCVKVVPGIFWIRMPMPFALNHINIWLLEDADGWTLVDCGIARDDVKVLWEKLSLEVLVDRPLKRVIVTHCHADHVGLAGWLLDNFGGTLWMSEIEHRCAQDVYAGVPGWQRDDSEAYLKKCDIPEERVQRCALSPDIYRRDVVEIPDEVNFLTQGQELQIGGRTWQVLIAQGHSPGHVSLFCPEIDVVIAGDQVLAQISSNVSVWQSNLTSNPLKLYLESLDELSRLPDETLVLTSHGRSFYGLHKRLAELNAHHAERLDLIRERAATGCTVAGFLPVLFGATLDDQQLPFAAGEIMAHLNYLKEAGELTCELSDKGVWVFTMV